jgi:regulator of replication initiation timing
MADIVARLRDADTTRRIGESYADTHERRQRDRDEAADTIATLRAEVERLTGERDRQYEENVSLIAENQKLRAALEPFAYLASVAHPAAIDTLLGAGFFKHLETAAALTQEKPHD